MRLLTVPLFASLLVARDATREPVAKLVVPHELAPVAEVAEPATMEPVLPIAEAVPTLAIRETSAPIPADVAVDVRRTSGGGWTVRLARKGYLVAMRHGGTRTAAANQAALELAPGDPEPVVWEATHLDTLATTRGTLRLDDAPTPRPRVHLAEAPVPAGSDERRRHSCTAHEDGAGGFSVLCRVNGMPTAANVTGDDEKADVWVAGGRPSPVVRLDLPASAAGVEARMVGYAAGVDGVVIRAEASRVAGEPRPVLTLLSADRAQPQVPRVTVKYRCCFGDVFD